MSCHSYVPYSLLISCLIVTISATPPSPAPATAEEPSIAQDIHLQPTGTYTFTTHSFEITDETRQDLDDPSKKRKLIVKCWIPQQSSSSPEPHKPFPLILFSHGYLGTTPDDYSLILEDMASHGYLIAAITHTSFAATTTLADGKIIPMDENRLNLNFKRMCVDQTIWSADAECVLNYLEHAVTDSTHPLYSMYDSKKIGMCGHSFGGSTSFLMCLTDERIKAGINFDGSLMFTQRASSLTKPFLFMWADLSLEMLKLSDEQISMLSGLSADTVSQFRGAFENAHDTATQPALSHMTIPQFSHVDFTKHEMLKEAPLPQNMISALALIRTSVINFFNKNL